MDRQMLRDWVIRFNAQDDWALMRRTDELFTARPFLGSRWMTAMLWAERYAINRKPTAATAIAAMGSLISSGDRNGRESD